MDLARRPGETRDQYKMRRGKESATLAKKSKGSWLSINTSPNRHERRKEAKLSRSKVKQREAR